MSNTEKYLMRITVVVALVAAIVAVHYEQRASTAAEAALRLSVETNGYVLEAQKAASEASTQASNANASALNAEHQHGQATAVLRTIQLLSTPPSFVERKPDPTTVPR